MRKSKGNTEEKTMKQYSIKVALLTQVLIELQVNKKELKKSPKQKLESLRKDQIGLKTTAHEQYLVCEFKLQSIQVSLLK